MAEPIAADTLRGLVGDMLVARLGLYFPPERWPDLVRRIAAATSELGYADSDACMRGLLANPPGRREMEILGRHLTVGETYFFRDPDLFATLEQQVLPELIRRRWETTRRIRIWSVGCSSGEEPYSIAMILAGLLPDLEHWDVSILATDINPHALAQAREGVYGRWSFRHPLAPSMQRWFRSCAGERRAVVPRIKSLVNFVQLNLAEDAYPSIETRAMDIVLCRNVLMYFHPQQIPRVLERLAGCLLDDGCLLLSPVENSLVTVPMLLPCRLPDLVLYRKAAGDDFLAATAIAALPILEPAVPSPGGAAQIPADIPAGPLKPELASRPLPEDAPTAAPFIPPPPGETLEHVRSLADRGLLAPALACCEQVLAQDRLNMAWIYLHASISLELGHTEAAMSALERCLYLEHDFIMAHFVLANLLWGRGRRKEGRRHYRNALELLAALDPEQGLAEAEGMTAGRLREIIEAILDPERGKNRQESPTGEVST